MRSYLMALAVVCVATGCSSSSPSPSPSPSMDVGDSGTSASVDSSSVDSFSSPETSSSAESGGGSGTFCVVGTGASPGDYCIEYLSPNPSDYMGALNFCVGHGGKASSMCPAGRTFGCTEAPGQVMGGGILWHYNDSMNCGACGSGEMPLNVDGTACVAMAVDAGPPIKVGPGGPVSAECNMALSTGVGVSLIYGLCTPDKVCKACLTTDYAAASCQGNKPFRDLFGFACLATGPAACATECGR
jgi:hypothetical protein